MAEQKDNTQGSASGDLRPAQEREVWKQIPEKDRVEMVKDYLKGRKD
jgi:hypothetical protein